MISKRQKTKKLLTKLYVEYWVLWKLNLKHPSLNTHVYDAMNGPNGKKFLNLMPKTRQQVHIEYFGIMAQEKGKSQYLKCAPILNKFLIVKDLLTSNSR
jgi:hypothetical protein